MLKGGLYCKWPVHITPPTKHGAWLWISNTIRSSKRHSATIDTLLFMATLDGAARSVSTWSDKRAGVADITHPYSTVSITCVGLTLRVTVEATTEKKYSAIIVRAKV